MGLMGYRKGILDEIVAESPLEWLEMSLVVLEYHDNIERKKLAKAWCHLLFYDGWNGTAIFAWLQDEFPDLGDYINKNFVWNRSRPRSLEQTKEIWYPDEEAV